MQRKREHDLSSKQQVIPSDELTQYHEGRIKKESWRERQEPDHEPEVKENLKPCSAILTVYLKWYTYLGQRSTGPHHFVPSRSSGYLI